MLNLIDKKIRQSFSNAALQYDVLTSMHQEIGRELVKKVLNENAQYILDIGMGTGRMTRALSFYFPESKVVGMDFADQMIDVAKAMAYLDGRDYVLPSDVATLCPAVLAHRINTLK